MILTPTFPTRPVVAANPPRGHDGATLPDRSGGMTVSALPDHHSAEAEALGLYLRQLLEGDELSLAAEVLLQMAEISATHTRKAVEEASQRGQLDRLLETIARGDGWLRLARANVIHGLRSLATAEAAASPCCERPRAELLGALRLTYRRRTLTADQWPSSKAMRLFACLVARRGAPLGSQAAIEHLWPELAPGRGRSSLRNCLYQVRYALRDLLGLPGEGVVRCRLQDTLALEARFETDVDEFERAVEQARTLPPREALPVASAADRLYRAPYLEGLEDAWAQSVRSRLESLRGQLLHLLAGCQLALGQARQAEETARRAMQHDDLCEQAWADLLAAQVGQGRESEARRLYRDAVAHFQSELGFRPTVLGEAYDRLIAPPAYLKVS